MALTSSLTAKPAVTQRPLLKAKESKSRVSLSIRFAGLVLKTYMAMSVVLVALHKVNQAKKGVISVNQASNDYVGESMF